MAFLFGKETFEGGSPGAFDSVGATFGALSCVLDTGSVLEGANSIRFDITGEAGGGAFEALASNQAELYIQFRVKFVSGFAFGASGYSGFMTLYDSSDNVRLNFNIEDYGNVQLTVNGDYGYAAMGAISTNANHRIEIGVKKATSGGFVKMWLNNTTEGSPTYTSGSANTGATAIRKARIGPVYAPEAISDWWIDDVIIDTAFIGTRTFDGQPTIKRLASIPFLGGSLRQRNF